MMDILWFCIGFGSAALISIILWIIYVAVICGHGILTIDETGPTDKYLFTIDKLESDLRKKKFVLIRVKKNKLPDSMIMEDDL